MPRLPINHALSVAFSGLVLLAIGATSACDEKAPGPDRQPLADQPKRGGMSRRAISMRRAPNVASPGGQANPEAPTDSSAVAALGSAAPSTATQAAPRDKALGLFVVSRRLDGPTKAVDDAIYGLESVDGVYAQLLWSTIEPAEGKLDWTTLDAELKRAIAHSKGLTISVSAGDATPDWVFKAGAKKLEFDVAHHDGKGGAAAEKIAIAAPWDPVFLAKWKTLVAAVGDHVRSIPGGYEHLRIVKITGINEFSSETRLPASRAGGAAAQDKGLTDNVKKWVAEGYKPSKVLDAYKQITDDFATSFPDKALGLEVLDSGGFPLIGEDGAPVKPGPSVPDGVTREMIDSSLAAYPTRFVVQSNGLRASAPDALVSGAAKRGAYVGWQTNNWLGAKSQHGVGCGGDDVDSARECSEDDFAQVLDRGIALGGHYIEVFPYDAVTFPKAMAAARAKLVTEHKP